MSARVSALWRYPVKGLSPEPLDAVTLTAGEYFPGDRLYAIENGPTGFDPAAPVWMPKIRFLMLMRDAKLARLTTRYDDAATTLVVREGEREVARGDLSDAAGRAAIAGFFADYIGAEMRGPAAVLTAPAGFRFTDSRSGFVSILNRGSIEDIGRVTGRRIDPLRFRGNLLVEGLPPWGEFDLLGRDVTVGATRLHVLARIRRCAATAVDPQAGRRDLDIPAALERCFGHADCGVYARIDQGGRIARGDAFAETAPRLV